MNEGDRVSWQSQSQGYHKVKEGVIVAVIPAGCRPSDVVFPSLYKGAGPGYGRDHESYVVKVGSRFYWPRAKALREVPEESTDG